MTEKEQDLKLLLVDDEEDFLTAAAEALRRRGMEVVAVTDARKALSSAKYGDFDVAVIDMKMPGMDGEELFRRLGRQEPQLPVIILTGHASVSQAFKTARDGVFDYLAKPCDMDALAAKIRQAHDVRRAEAARGATGLDPCVLLIDDEIELLDSLGPVLERRGLSLLTANSAAVGLQLLARNPVDVVVLDLKMPGMDGMTALKEIRARRPDVEVILLTGHPTVDTALEGVKAGAFAYLIKPAAVDDLVAMIRRAHEHRRSALEKSRDEKVRDIMNRYGA
jgi:DNA-binding NtrC family response regulator